METRQFEKNPILAKLLPGLTVGAGLVALGVGAFIFLRPYGVIIGMGLFILSFIVDIFVFFRVISRAECPMCARPLKRTSLDKGEYPCEVCGINWVLESQK